jgi:hypothetical protein
MAGGICPTHNSDRIMTQAANEHSGLVHECRQTVAHLTARYDWQLLDHDEFVRRTQAELHAGTTTDPQCAAIYTYSKALHLACSGAEGPERQRRAYAELFRYLYDSARQRYPDVCNDAARRAIEYIFTSFEHCRQPGAFLAFALQQLIDAAQAIRQQASQQMLTTPIDIEREIEGER